MGIEVTCKCGKLYIVKDEHGGKKTKCTECGGIISIPKRVPPAPEKPIFPLFKRDLADLEFAVGKVYHSRWFRQQRGEPLRILFSPEQLVDFYSFYADKLACYWSLDETEASKDALLIDFFVKGDYSTYLRFSGMYWYRSERKLNIDLVDRGYDEDELGLDDMFRRNFTSEIGTIGPFAVKTLIQNRELVAVSPENIEQILIDRMSGDLVFSPRKKEELFFEEEGFAEEDDEPPPDEEDQAYSEDEES